MIPLHRNLPDVSAGLGRLGFGKSGWGELRNDFVDVPAAVADHEQDLYDSSGT